MRVSALQLPIVIGDRKKNAKTLRRMMAEAMEAKPDAVVLPELWDIGFFPRPLADFTDAEGGAARALLSGLAAEYGVNVVGGSVAAACGDAVHNRCFVFDRSGALVASYDKTHLFSPAKEERHFTKGQALASFSLDGVPCAVIICYDLRFPELSRRLALGGAAVLFVPAAWPTARLAHWRLLAEARAVENQMFVAAVNGSGAFANGMPLAGHSLLLDPWGERLAEAGAEGGVISADFDLGVREKIKRTMDVFHDRRAELYGEEREAPDAF